MGIEIWGLTLQTIGELIIGLSIVRVHVRIMQEHKLDKKVYRSIKREKFWAIIGIVLIIIGYTLKVAHVSGGGVF
jgi:uncharacterized membrane protein YidH (DUF202 family)